ncbi:hypothetical protein COT44_03405 [Candidatus Shapirobacteria bacterium CG08_land_8_20_14_0_20_39_18]|uniref:Uncharacterized protein n=1 Tax=Candidatus Shapirobacteria bacterium CG08_land_8_20_14_0_20_39_18 TaxID=1974883 RepID=A0A2M6XCR1_9BACT|nr:MAG: hypothetical protein COT44_03405 [Candidatus Shapirobacteria bacterium CG08_land_8_20_14_0_20_39_18]PIY65107.1 MAG: hypothetical protein COY91_03515 [Candidatus Shapirobacteria bacterium CG_4_10_14_0_8_um_filter_39_15]PJE68291.1 MAG: hypothetical protein COU94_02580 [Candidatus Shapirobacteria bacterium CG10_big_fil_rev_8_21_14_0_10_38_8]
MEQHPVPQNIASYEFRLVGDMTLKQFLELAGGLVVALIFYASGLAWYFKWPLVFVSAVLGVGLAFFPIEERPLETWLMSFLKTIYSPTQYLWKKTPKKPEFLEERPPLPVEPAQQVVTPQDKIKMIEYVATLPVAKSAIDQKEDEFVNQIKNMFSMTTPPVTRVTNEIPNPGNVQVHKLSGPFVLEVQQPNIQPVHIPKYTPPHIPYIPPPSTFRQPIQAQPARYSSEIPMPSAPTIPNILAGMVTDKNGRILENVILEILDQGANPVRALRTNKIGQFRTATQLANGFYDILLEKDGYAFDNVRVELKGEIVEPIEIKAK